MSIYISEDIEEEWLFDALYVLDVPIVYANVIVNFM